VRDVSKVLMVLGKPPIPVIPRDLHTAGDVLEAADVILECFQVAYVSSHNPFN
jgi:hypothetical protein